MFQSVFFAHTIHGCDSSSRVHSCVYWIPHLPTLVVLHSDRKSSCGCFGSRTEFVCHENTSHLCSFFLFFFSFFCKFVFPYFSCFISFRFFHEIRKKCCLSFVFFIFMCQMTHSTHGSAWGRRWVGVQLACNSAQCDSHASNASQTLNLNFITSLIRNWAWSPLLCISFHLCFHVLPLFFLNMFFIFIYLFEFLLFFEFPFFCISFHFSLHVHFFHFYFLFTFQEKGGGRESREGRGEGEEGVVQVCRGSPGSARVRRSSLGFAGGHSSAEFARLRETSPEFASCPLGRWCCPSCCQITKNLNWKHEASFRWSKRENEPLACGGCLLSFLCCSLFSFVLNVSPLLPTDRNRIVSIKPSFGGLCCCLFSWSGGLPSFFRLFSWTGK